MVTTKRVFAVYRRGRWFLTSWLLSFISPCESRAVVLLSTIPDCSRKTVGAMRYSNGTEIFLRSFNIGSGETFSELSIECAMNSPVREFLEARLPEPGGESIWSAEGNRASKRLTRCPATNNGGLDSRARTRAIAPHQLWMLIM
jgi:hypothetical protein